MELQNMWERKGGRIDPDERTKGADQSGLQAEGEGEESLVRSLLNARSSVEVLCTTPYWYASYYEIHTWPPMVEQARRNERPQTH
jgi:hypothetical protein